MPVKLLVLEASGMIDIDYTGSQILQQTIATLRSRSIDVAIARLSNKEAQIEAGRARLITALGPERVFKSVDEAVRRIGPDAKLSPGVVPIAINEPDLRPDATLEADPTGRLVESIRI